MSYYKQLEVDLDGTPYDLQIGRGAIKNLPGLLTEKTSNPNVLIVCDSFFEHSVAQKIKDSLTYEGGYHVWIHSLNAGKGNKNINAALKIFAFLEENNFARDSTLIALGGGVIGDMAGFIASTWLRGMHLIHIPTTLLAMVDSSVGGKTAINFRKTINGIGSYYHPIINLVDLDLVDSLSERDYLSGLAEVIKCSIIADDSFFSLLMRDRELILQRDEEKVIDFIARTIEIKIDHVKGDVKEGGKRLLLNYGHTLGHSIEISTEKNGEEQLRHGEGVAVGIAAAAYISEKHFGLQPDLRLIIEEIFKSYGLPVNIGSNALGFNRDRLLDTCRTNVHKDKKRLGNKLRLILATKLGEASVHNDVDIDLVNAAFERVVYE